VCRKGWVEMDRRLLVLIVAAVALIGVVNATAFAYRWMTGTVEISGPSDATGAACTGFYSSAAQGGIDLPSVGTNYNAPTYGSYEISVTPGDVVCNWTKDGTEYKLYESIEVTIPITVGSWYIQDFYGFGYYRGTSSVYVYFRVDDDAADNNILTTAYLIIRDPYGNEKARLDLTSLGNQTNAITLSPGDGLRLDLYFDAGNAGTVNFKVGVYVTQKSGESPSP
jgi:uncharacterized membrane protein